MKKRLIFCIMLVSLLALCFQSALAATCNVSFKANGTTYHIVHHPEGTGYFTTTGNHPNLFSAYFWDHELTPEQAEYDEAYRIATNNHVAQCPYYSGDLGDESVPMALLCGLAVLTAAGAIVVHRKRRSFC